MAGNPRVVTAEATFLWDHAPQRLGRGTIIDVPAGSALERAIGADKLIPLYGAPPVTVAQASEPAPEPAQDAPGDGGHCAPPARPFPPPRPAGSSPGRRQQRREGHRQRRGRQLMAANGKIVNTDITVTWDGVSQRIARGTVIDVPASGALITALGAGNLTSLTTQQQSSDGGVSIGPFMENLTGGGQEPYAWAQ